MANKQTDRQTAIQTDNHTQGRISAANLICISHQLALSWVVLVIRSVVLVCVCCARYRNPTHPAAVAADDDGDWMDRCIDGWMDG